MKCFLCKYSTISNRTLEEIQKSVCGLCRQHDKFIEKNDDDIYTEAIELYRHKTERPNYADYSDTARQTLFEDCLKEVRTSYESAKGFIRDI